MANASDMRFEWSEGADAVRAYETAYQDFGDRIQTTTIFNSYNWQHCFLNALGERSFFLLSFYSNNTLLGFIPMTYGEESIKRIPCKTLRLLGFPYSDRSALIICIHEDLSTKSIPEAIKHFPKRLDIAIFDELLASDSNKLKEHSTALGFKVRTRHSSSTPCLDFDQDDHGDITGKYSRSLKTRLQRARNKQKRTGEIRFEYFRPDIDRLENYLDALAKIENTSWKGQQGVGIFNEPRASLFKDISSALTKDQQLLIGHLYLDEKLIAYRYGFIYQDTYYDYNFAHLPEYNHLSPGRVLLDDMIRAFQKEGLKSVDASRGDIIKKNILADWPTQPINHYVVWVCNKTVVGYATYILFTHAAKYVKILKSQLSKITGNAKS